MLTVSNDFILILSTLFSSAWRIAVSFKVPGTNINIPEFSLAMITIVFAIRHVPQILNIAPNVNTGGDRGEE